MFDAAVYVTRRNGLQQQFKHGLLLFVGNADSPMNYTDNTYHFRQDSSFLYYWGVDDPNLAGVIDVDAGRQVLFGDDFTIDDIVWRGPQPSIAERAARAGIAETAPVSDAGQRARGRRAARAADPLPAAVPRRQRAAARAPARHPGGRGERSRVGGAGEGGGQAARVQGRRGDPRRSRPRSTSPTSMHVLAMRLARPGKYEREVAGAMAGLVESHGLQLAFPIIFSVHGETLHNHYHGNRMCAGQMAVNDSGVESTAPLRERHHPHDPDRREVRRAAARPVRRRAARAQEGARRGEARREVDGRPPARVPQPGRGSEGDRLHEGRPRRGGPRGGACDVLPVRRRPHDGPATCTTWRDLASSTSATTSR